jgi:hypothetical protein
MGQTAVGVGQHLGDASKFGGGEVFAFDNQDPEEGGGAGVDRAIDRDNIESALDVGVFVFDVDAIDVFFDAEFDRRFVVSR